jgi:hypothetical protein
MSQYTIIFNSVCSECKHLCEETLFNTCRGMEHINFVCEGDDVDQMKQHGLLGAAETNQFFADTAINHLICSAVINKHMNCLVSLHDHGCFDNLFDEGWSDDTTQLDLVFPINKDWQPVSSDDGADNYAALHTICYAYFDHTIYSTILRWYLDYKASHKYSVHFLIGDLEKCIRLNNQDQLSALVSVMAQYGLSQADMCYAFQKRLDQGYRLHVSVMNYCAHHLQITCPISQSYEDQPQSCFVEDYERY